MKIIQRKRELREQWDKLKKLGENEKLTYNQFYKIRNEEQKYYDRWKFLEGFAKAKEKIENEKKKN